jgi:hypothetical protein
MTADQSVRLTPALALAYLRELSTDVRAALALDAAGEPLAGEEALAAPARRLLARAPGAAPDGVRRETHADGILLAARGEHGVALAVLAGRHALLPLLEHDLRTALADLAPR